MDLDEIVYFDIHALLYYYLLNYLNFKIQVRLFGSKLTGTFHRGD